MRQLIINNKNVSSDKSTYTYKFNGQVGFNSGEKVALDTLSMYYSWPNITEGQKNNVCQYTWTDGQPYTVTVEDGFYTIAELNKRLQFEFVKNKHYVENSEGNYVYFINLSENASRYAIQLDVTPVPTQTDATQYGWTKPSTASWNFPSVSTYPQFIVPDKTTSNSIASIIGYSAGTYPSVQTPASGTFSDLSSTTPQVTPVSSVIVKCSLINNQDIVPNDIFYSFTPNATYGSQISIVPPTKTYIDILSNSYTEFSVSFVDQKFNPLPILDDNVVILLTIARPGEL